MQPKELLNEAEWTLLNNKRFRKWKTNRAAFLQDAATAIERDKFGDWLRFVKRFAIPVMPDKRLPYATRVRLAGLTMVYAIEAKDEAAFLARIDAEIKLAGELAKKEAGQ